jgi:hypothetical protein
VNALAALRPKADAPADVWAARISACWRASLEAILEVGRLLAAAKAALPHGEFGAMCEAALPFTARTAQMLMAIAADPQISNPKFISHLPASWGALYELTTLGMNEEQFEQGIEKGIITPDKERRELISGARAMMGSRVEPADSLDFLPTPPWATRALMERVFPHLGIERMTLSKYSIQEPACGEGHMSEVLREYSDQVYATDIHDYGGYPDDVLDFLLGPEVVPYSDLIISNPPFGDKAEKFTLRAFELARVGVAMFVPLRWLETIGRYQRLFLDRPPTLISFFVERVNLCKGRWEPDGSTATAYIWLVWIKEWLPQPPFWIPPTCREQLSRSDDVERFTAHPVIKRRAA